MCGVLMAARRCENPSANDTALPPTTDTDAFAASADAVPSSPPQQSRSHVALVGIYLRHKPRRGEVIVSKQLRPQLKRCRLDFAVRIVAADVRTADTVLRRMARTTALRGERKSGGAAAAVDTNAVLISTYFDLEN